jgi:His/Glu/Gln/Arg/opine family amino acid ABC transporter permease subunit
MMPVLAGAGWEPFTSWPIWRFLLEGFWLSVKIAGFAIGLSIVVGVVMAVGRLAPVRAVRWFAGAYVETFRATPLLLLLFIVFFGAGRLDLDYLLDVPVASVVLDDQAHLTPIASAVIALALYNSAVVAEIVRAGILSISKGVIEATRALGLTYLQSMRYVALPIALRRMSPGLVSQLITLFKDTSLVSILGITELLRHGRIIYEQPLYANAVETLIVVAIMYFLPCYALSLLAQRLEKGPEMRERIGVIQPEAIP